MLIKLQNSSTVLQFLFNQRIVKRRKATLRCYATLYFKALHIGAKHLFFFSNSELQKLRKRSKSYDISLATSQRFNYFNYHTSLIVYLIDVIPEDSEARESSLALICNTLQHRSASCRLQQLHINIKSI